jgi:hypothetical protein
VRVETACSRLLPKSAVAAKAQVMRIAQWTAVLIVYWNDQNIA